MNLFKKHSGEIAYGVLDTRGLRNLLQENLGEVIVFSFGDGILDHSSFVSGGLARLDNIEQVSITIRKLIASPEIDIKKFLVYDAKIAQSAERTAMAKGSAVKGFRSLNLMRVKFSKSSVLFISDEEDSILERHLRPL